MAKKKPNYKMMLVILDEKLKKQVDKYCKEQGITMKSFVTSSIINYMRGANP